MKRILKVSSHTDIVKHRRQYFRSKKKVQILQHQCVYIYVTFLSVIIGHSE